MMVVALGGLQSIPHHLYEAADIDGAGSWTKLKLITLPLLKPVMTPVIVLGLVWTFNNLIVIWQVSIAGEPSDSTPYFGLIRL
jgi:arabinogalactan oligomer/maltooligosaccharide transport system permease protein